MQPTNRQALITLSKAKALGTTIEKIRSELLHPSTDVTEILVKIENIWKSSMVPTANIFEP